MSAQADARTPPFPHGIIFLQKSCLRSQIESV